MSLRAQFLNMLHRLLRVPPPAPVVRWRTMNSAYCWYVAVFPLPDFEKPEFTIHTRSSNTIQ